MQKKYDSKYKNRRVCHVLGIISGVVLISFAYPLFINPSTLTIIPFPPYYAEYSNATPGNSKINESLKSEISEMNKSKPIRLHFYNRPKWISLKAFESCQYKCIASEGANHFNTAHAVLFHGPRLKGKPPKKIFGQIWVMYGKESPVHYWNNLEEWTNLFNWTMTYRRDSDILTMYGQFRFKNRPNINEKDGSTNLTTNWNTKDRMAAWFVSNCRTSSRRQEYTKLLKKYNDVHIYGNCGDHKCPRSNEKSCREMLKNHYKFYLSFENSFCRDYITEKAFKLFTFASDTIPVMRGHGNYSMFFPPGSFLNTQDFSKVERLAKRMMEITANQSSFEKHFLWKKSAYANYNGKWCELCERLHFPNKYKRLYANIRNWNEDKPRSACRSPTDIV